MEELMKKINESEIIMMDIKKESVVDYILTIYEKDYESFSELASKYNATIISIKENEFYRMKKNVLKRKSFFIGIVLFILFIYALSTRIWAINIKTDQFVSPYEIRTYITNLGIKEGISKKKIDVFELEKKIPDVNGNVVWVRARIRGTELEITVSERQNPPNIVKDETPCDLLAKKDGIIKRIYTLSGTAMVKEGDLVKKGDVLIKGQQGNEESLYDVKAEGSVIATTFFESIEDFKIPKYKRVRTGNNFSNKYINVGKKKIYLKNRLNKYDKYDKIEDNSSFVKIETYYEVKEIEYTKEEREKILDDRLNKMYSDIVINFQHEIKILNRLLQHDELGESFRLRVLITTEEDLIEKVG